MMWRCTICQHLNLNVLMVNNTNFTVSMYRQLDENVGILVVWLKQACIIILQSYNPLDSWPDTVDTVDAVDVIRRPITAQHTRQKHSHRLFHMQLPQITQEPLTQSVQPQAPFCYISGSSGYVVMTAETPSDYLVCKFIARQLLILLCY